MLFKVIRFIVPLKNITSLRVGTGSEGLDSLLSIDNKAAIMGTSIAGVFRSNISDIMLKNLIFPKNDESENGIKKLSKIFFYDMLGNQELQKNDWGYRPHIRMNNENGTNSEKGLFDDYYIKKGQKFLLQMDIHIDKEDTKENEKAIIEEVKLFISKIGIQDISFGSHSTFGYGEFEIEESKYYRENFDFKIEENFEKYMKLRVIANKEELHNYKNIELIDLDNESNYTEILLNSTCEDGFIIKGTQKRKIFKDNSEMKFDVSYAEYIDGKEVFLIPGSSLKGLLRFNCAKILSIFDNNGSNKIIENIWGSNPESADEIKQKGIIKVYDSLVGDSDVSMYNRVKIDRLTGGVYSGACFHEELVIPKNLMKFRVKILNGNKYSELAKSLIILSFRDIGLGYMTIGSGENVGYGRLEGHELVINRKEIKFENRQLNSINDFRPIEAIIKSLTMKEGDSSAII